MATRTIEIEDNLREIIDSCQEDVKDLAVSWLDDNPDSDGPPDLFNDLDYSGEYNEIIDGAVPIYTREQTDLFYLYGDDFEEAFDNAGIGEKDNSKWPFGWKAAAIYCYLDQEVSAWYEDNKENIYDAWKEEHPEKEGSE